MPFECPPEPDSSWVPGETEELAAAAEKLFKEKREGGLMVAFPFQPRAVREKYIEMAKELADLAEADKHAVEGTFEYVGGKERWRRTSKPL